MQINDSTALGKDGSTLVLDGGVLQAVGVGAAIELNKAAKITNNNGTIDTTSRNVSLTGDVSGVGQLVKSGSGKFPFVKEVDQHALAPNRYGLGPWDPGKEGMLQQGVIGGDGSQVVSP